MADQPTNPLAPGIGPGPMNVPQAFMLTEFAMKFALAMEAGSISITFFRPGFVPSEVGLSSMVHAVPSAGVTMSPILAKDLYKVLGKVLADYEKLVGAPIPDIPTQPQQ